MGLQPQYSYFFYTHALIAHWQFSRIFIEVGIRTGHGPFSLFPVSIIPTKTSWYLEPDKLVL